MNFPWKKVITNKYLIASAVFIVYLFFADKNNVFEQYKLRQQYIKVKREHTYYENQIKDARERQEELFGSDKALEKFGREKYLMKKDNEDVFVIVKSTPQQSEESPEE